MRLEWIVEEGDIAGANGFFEAHRRNPLVRRRIERNLAPDWPPVSKARPRRG